MVEFSRQNYPIGGIFDIVASLRVIDLEFVISGLDLVEIDTYIAKKARNNIHHVFGHVSVGGVSKRP